MSMVKRVLGGIGIILGGIGIVLCIAIIFGAWWINGPITNGLLQLFPPIEAALLFGDTTAEQFGQFVGETSDNLDEAADVEKLALALEDELKQVSVYVDVASGLAESAEETISEVSSSVQTSEAPPAAAQAASRLLEKLTDVGETIETVEALALDVSDGRVEKIDQLANNLETLETKSKEVQTVIDQTQEEVNEIKIKVPRWINIGSLIVTFIFAWFGIAQFLLARQSWFWLRLQTESLM
ncbi:MAG: hypothetical protein AAGD96_06285 [Chloroflexota bacterium]